MPDNMYLILIVVVLGLLLGALICFYLYSAEFKFLKTKINTSASVTEFMANTGQASEQKQTASHVVTKLIIVNTFPELPETGDVDNVYKINVPYVTYFRYNGNEYVEINHQFLQDGYKYVSKVTVGYGSQDFEFVYRNKDQDNTPYNPLVDWYFKGTDPLFIHTVGNGTWILDRKQITFIHIDNTQLG